jgi:hypothetical protein
MHGYRRMIDSQYSDFYSSDTETWTATSPDKDFDEELPLLEFNGSPRVYITRESQKYTRERLSLPIFIGKNPRGALMRKTTCPTVSMRGRRERIFPYQISS